MQVDNRKPFDLQKALAGAKVEFRHESYMRHQVLKVIHEPLLGKNPLLVILSNGTVLVRAINGTAYPSVYGESSDLVMSAPKMVTKTAWGVKYRGQLLSALYSTETDAASAWNKRPQNAHLYKTVTVTWQEEEES